MAPPSDNGTNRKQDKEGLKKIAIFVFTIKNTEYAFVSAHEREANNR